MRSSVNMNLAQREAFADIRSWTRQRFALPDDAAVLVAELTCAVPLCPPLETAVAFWTEDGKRHQFKLLKPMQEIAADDIAWLIWDLNGPESAGWDCC